MLKIFFIFSTYIVASRGATRRPKGPLKSVARRHATTQRAPKIGPTKSEKYRESSGSHLHGWVARRATRRPKGPLKSVASRLATTQRAPKIGREAPRGDSKIGREAPRGDSKIGREAPRDDRFLKKQKTYVNLDTIFWKKSKKIEQFLGASEHVNFANMLQIRDDSVIMIRIVVN